MKTHTKFVIVALTALLIGSVITYFFVAEEDYSKRSDEALAIYTKKHGPDIATIDLVQRLSNKYSWPEELERTGDLLTLRKVSVTDEGYFPSVIELYARNYNEWYFVYAGQEAPPCALLDENLVSIEDYEQLSASIFNNGECYAEVETDSFSVIKYADYEEVMNKQVFDESVESNTVIAENVHSLFKEALSDFKFGDFFFSLASVNSGYSGLGPIWRTNDGYPIYINESETATVRLNSNQVCRENTHIDLWSAYALMDSLLSKFEKLGFERSPMNSLRFTGIGMQDDLIQFGYFDEHTEYFGQGLINPSTDQILFVSYLTNCFNDNEHLIHLQLFDNISDTIDEQLTYVKDLGSNNMFAPNFYPITPTTIIDNYGKFNTGYTALYAKYENGKWVRLGQSQDILLCSDTDKHELPIDIAPTCLVDEQEIDRLTKEPVIYQSE